MHYRAMALILRGWAVPSKVSLRRCCRDPGRFEKERATALLYESYTLGLLADACIKNERCWQALDFLGRRNCGLMMRT